LLQELKQYMGELSQMSRDLEAGDESQLEKTFRAAQEFRAGWAGKNSSSEKDLK
jgi:prephenate dehydrogenase